MGPESIPASFILDNPGINPTWGGKNMNSMVNVWTSVALTSNYQTPYLIDQEMSLGNPLQSRARHPFIRFHKPGA
ncbi:hypothetical protein RSOLAG22IIIB_08292 [Rhizoctonia solani]|uniref:Uncharacterized protein n=1 Tax=Rhizoctonia solani TaxID=456999 RepID=A0A0K6FSJ1_9AGAM|nr:hypothetical protein RSOLAG22IIIB_08292 [Rhizoctonia solani]